MHPARTFVWLLSETLETLYAVKHNLKIVRGKPFTIDTRGRDAISKSSESNESYKE
jgi:hypothetical protein